MAAVRCRHDVTEPAAVPSRAPGARHRRRRRSRRWLPWRTCRPARCCASPAATWTCSSPTARRASSPSRTAARTWRRRFSVGRWRAASSTARCTAASFDLRDGEVVTFPTTGGLDAEGGSHPAWSPEGSDAQAAAHRHQGAGPGADAGATAALLPAAGPRRPRRGRAAAVSGPHERRRRRRPLAGRRRPGWPSSSCSRRSAGCASARTPRWIDPSARWRTWPPSPCWAACCSSPSAATLGRPSPAAVAGRGLTALYAIERRAAPVARAGPHPAARRTWSSMPSAPWSA